MPTYVWVVIAIVVVLAVIAAIAVAQQQRSQRLRTTFGDEYERTVSRSGKRGEAEKELAGRMSRRKQLHIEPLPEPARQQYARRWQQVQAHFVDAPAESLREADTLINQVMTDRGYPMADFEQRAADVSVDHADVVENYRGAHAVSERVAKGQTNTEEQRMAMTQYRALFDDLLADESTEHNGEQPHPAATSARPQAAPAPPPPPPPANINRGREA